MSYAAIQDMIDRFGSKELIELSDHGNTGAIDNTVLQGALDDASAEIDGYLAAVYTLPLSTIPVVLKRLCGDMARYYLMGDRVQQAASDRYKNAVAFLRGVADEKVSLGLDAAAAPALESGGPRVVAADRVFNAGSLGDY